MQVVVDRPDMVRCMYLTKRLAITDLKVDVGRLAKKKEIEAAFEGALPQAPYNAFIRDRQTAMAW